MSDNLPYLGPSGELYLKEAADYRKPCAEDLTGRFDDLELAPLWYYDSKFAGYWRYNLDRYRFPNRWYVYLGKNRWLGCLYQEEEGSRFGVWTDCFTYFHWDTGLKFETQSEALKALLRIHSEGAETR